MEYPKVVVTSERLYRDVQIQFQDCVVDFVINETGEPSVATVMMGTWEHNGGSKEFVMDKSGQSNNIRVQLDTTILRLIEGYNKLKAEPTSDIVKRPPLGLKPLWLLQRQRLDEIKEAIERYEAEQMEIPSHWIGELQTLEPIVKEFEKTKQS